jgi:hypothetical protein
MTIEHFKNGIKRVKSTCTNLIENPTRRQFDYEIATLRAKFAELTPILHSENAAVEAFSNAREKIKERFAKTKPSKESLVALLFVGSTALSLPAIQVHGDAHIASNATALHNEIMFNRANPKTADTKFSHLIPTNADVVTAPRDI